MSRFAGLVNLTVGADGDLGGRLTVRLREEDRPIKVLGRRWNIQRRVLVKEVDGLQRHSEDVHRHDLVVRQSSVSLRREP